jgi:hypothetical protein
VGRAFACALKLAVIAAEMPYFIYNDNDTEVEVSIVVSSEDADNVDYDSEHFKGTLVDKTFTDEDMQEADHYVLNGGSSFVWVKDAGVPCIVRWGTPTENPGDVIEDPIFTNVEVTITDQSDFNDDDDDNDYETDFNGLRFQAQIAPVQVTAGSRTLLLGGENKLYKPDKSMWVYATRAYFTYTSGSGISMAREFVMDFGEGEQTTTYIDNITVEDNRESQVEGIFNLNGQRLDAPQKGINIINGRKVVIK